MKNFNWKKILIWILGIWIGLKLLGKVFKPIGHMFDALGKSLTDKLFNKENAADNSGNGAGGVNESDRAQVVNEVADKLQYAIHAYTKVGWWWVSRFEEDEDEVIKQLNRLKTASESRQVSVRYGEVTAALKGKQSLRSDVYEYLSATERSRINAIVLANLS